MTLIEQAIQAACDNTQPKTRARNRALASVRWVLAAAVGDGLVYTCLDNKHGAILTDDPGEAIVFDGRDNEKMKADFYSVLVGCRVEPVLVDMEAAL